MAENNLSLSWRERGQTPTGTQTVVLGLREVHPGLLERWGWSRAKLASGRAGTGEGRVAVPRPSSSSGGG